MTRSNSNPDHRPARRTLLAGGLLACLVASLWLVGSASAGTFPIAWNGDPQTHGLAPKTDQSAPCHHVGAATSLYAGTLATYGGCFWLFNAPGAATIQSLAITGHFTKASTSANLCARSFADTASANPLNQCTAGDFSQTITAGGKWIEIGLYNKYTAPITIGTTDANNANFATGTLTLDDPTPPSLILSSDAPAFLGGDSLSLNYTAADPESRAGSVSWTLDGAGGGALVSDNCTDVYACGTTATGTFAPAGLSALADGPHTIRLVAHSPGGDTGQEIRFATDHTAPQLTSGLTVDYDKRRVSLLVQDTTSGIASATLYADGTAIPTITSPAAGKPAGTLVASGVIPAGARLDGATIDLAARDSATPANTLDTRASSDAHLVIPIRPTPPAAPAPTGSTTGDQPASPGGPAAGATAAVSQNGVTMSIRVNRRVITYGQRLWVTGKLVVASGATTPTRILVVARPLRREFAKRYRRSTIVPVRKDGSFAARLAPALVSTIKVIALADHQPAHLAEATLGRIGVRVRITNVRVTALLIGQYNDPALSAQVLPAVPGMQLLWVAKVASSDRAICPTGDQPITDARGRVSATCHVANIPTDVRYALRLIPDTSSRTLLLPASSPWVRATRRY